MGFHLLLLYHSQRFVAVGVLLDVLAGWITSTVLLTP